MHILQEGSALHTSLVFTYILITITENAQELCKINWARATRRLFSLLYTTNA
jgi:hypothetical protein